ncbi:unnamed protein product [Closterium sp. NIES-65]|nr:unnamed protein product [Closterium sp. NIES-65]
MSHVSCLSVTPLLAVTADVSAALLVTADVSAALLVHAHLPCLQLHAARFMAEEVVTAEEIASWQADVEAEFERAFENTSKQQVSPQDWLAANWQGEALGSLGGTGEMVKGGTGEMVKGGTGEMVKGGTGEMVKGGTGEMVKGGTGEMVKGGTGEMVKGGTGEMVKGGTGEMVKGGTGEMVKGGTGEMVKGGTGEMVKGGTGEMVKGGTGEMVKGGTGEMVKGGTGEMVKGGRDGEVERTGDALCTVPPDFTLHPQSVCTVMPPLIPRSSLAICRHPFWAIAARSQPLTDPLLPPCPMLPPCPFLPCSSLASFRFSLLPSHPCFPLFLALIPPGAPVALLLENRRKMMATGEGIDWAMAEALAFGSLLLPFDPSLNQTADSNPTHAVRLSGQDCERGTFNHRHAVMHDQTTGQRYTPLQHVAAGQERFMVCNSSLSEAAVLGFEYGFSLENENALVCWEAQFGDFANNAQAIIDNFIVSGEDKWMTPTGLVLLLPHGFDGQGPEHSSARLERYLQLVNDDADHLPGYSPHLAAQIEAGFTIADRDNKGHVSLSDLLEFMQSQYGLGHDYVTALAHQMHIDESNQISKADWESFMVRWMRRNAQRDNNVCVVNLTTPANYFHALRRQVNRHFSKPLVIMSPKYLLHHKPCASPLSHFTSGTFFQPVIADGDIGDNMRHLHADKLLPPGEMKRLVLCSGKIYYSLAHARRARKQWEVGLMRIEQLAPMAVDHVARVINSHSAAELVWAQVGAPPLLPLLLAPSLCCPPLAPPLCSSSGLMRIEQMVPMAVDHMARVINSHSNAELVWAQSAAASKTGRYGRSPSGSRDSPLAPSRSDQPSWRSAAAAPPPPAGPGAAGAGGGGSTGWGDSADGGRSAGGAAPGGAWARGGPGKNDNAWGRGGGAGAPGGARGGPGGNPWHTGGGGVGVLTGAWQQPLQHLQQPAPPPLSQQQAQLDQAQAGKGARKGDGGGALDRAGESANGGSANGGSAGDASVGAARAGGREWMVAVSACLIGHAVEVQLVQGDSYSGIFHAANEEDYGESAYASNKEDLEN